MLKNYLKSALRNIFKNRLTSVINFIGLTAAIACCLFLYFMIGFIMSMDTFHVNSDKIFMVWSMIEESGDEKLYAPSPHPLGPAMKNDHPQIVRSARIASGNAVFRLESLEFDERIRFVDDQFLNMFSFALKSGNPEVLSERDCLVLTETLADKYFGTMDPMGKQIRILFENDEEHIFTVRGIAENPPDNSSFRFGALIPYHWREQVYNISPDNWKTETLGTFFQVNDPDDANDLLPLMTSYRDIYNSNETERKLSEFYFQPLKTLAINATRAEKCFTGGSHPTAIYATIVIGILILASGCFNYVNTAIATASRRLKEIGIRKVVGSTRIQLTIQFIFENMLICMLALIGGLFVYQYLFAPGFNEVVGETILNTSWMGSLNVWLFLAVLLMITALGAGLYPSLLISSLQPVKIFSKRQDVSGGSWFMRFSLTVQFILSFFMIYSGVAFIFNNNYIKGLEYGYRQDNMVAVRLNNPGQFNVLRNIALSNSNIIAAAGTRSHIGIESARQTKIRIHNEEHEVGKFDFSPEYFSFLGLGFIEGNIPQRQLNANISKSVVVNQKFAEKYNIRTEGVNFLTIDGEEYTITGIIRDFHYQQLNVAIKPVIIRFIQDSEYRFLSLRIMEGSRKNVEEFLNNSWNRQFPDSPYISFFVDDIVSDLQRQLDLNADFLIYSSAIVLAISCMGLLGLISLTCLKREKEISIRKVLGAGTGQVLKLINRDFLLSMLIAFIISAPISFIAMEGMLNLVFENRTAMGPMQIGLSLMILLVIAASTTFSHVYRAARVNPVKLLRTE